MEDDGDIEADESPRARHREMEELINRKEASDMSDSDSDADSAAHVSTDADSEIDDKDYKLWRSGTNSYPIRK